MGTPSTTQAMLSPDGKVADIPVERVQDAVKAGYKVGVDMLGPDGSKATIPTERAEEAQKAGYKQAQIIAKGTPQESWNAAGTNMQPSYSAMAAGNSPSGADPHNPGNPNLDALPEDERASVNAHLADVAQLTTPMQVMTTAGLMAPTVKAARDAAGKYIGGKVAEEGPSMAGAAINAAPKVVHITEQALEKFAQNYPAFTKLAEGVGKAGTGVGTLASAYQVFKILQEKMGK